MNVAIIPARGGSRRIPRKNTKLFHGKPIITYSIEAAKRSFVFDRIWVSTDDIDIAEISHGAGVYVLFRPAELARDEVGTQAVMKHALISLGYTGFACCIYPCAPLLQPSTLCRARQILEQTEQDYVVPVATWLRDPGQFYMGRTAAFTGDRPLLGPSTALMEIPVTTDCDINTPEDWARAERMYSALHEEVATA